MDYRIFNMHADVNACSCAQGCTDTIRESALQVDSGSKMPCCTRESNLCWWCASLMLYQLSYIPIPWWLTGLRLQLGFRIQISFRNIKNGFEMHFECEFSQIRILTLTWSYLCNRQVIHSQWESYPSQLNYSLICLTLSQETNMYCLCSWC